MYSDYFSGFEVYSDYVYSDFGAEGACILKVYSDYMGSVLGLFFQNLSVLGLYVLGLWPSHECNAGLARSPKA